MTQRPGAVPRLKNKIMKKFTCKNSNSKTVEIMCDASGRYLAAAMQDGEYWFTIGWYKSEKTAIRASIKKLAKHGYELNA